MITDFIKNTINDIFSAFPKLKECLYSFDKYSNTHFIKIDSVSIYNSEEFARLDGEISVEFYSLGVDGSLCIISPESQTDLIDPEAFLNKNLLEVSFISDGIIHYNIVDSFHHLDNNVLVHNSIEDFFNPDNSTTYSLAA